MSTFLIQCPDCGIELEVDEQYIGRKAVCSICQYRFVIPEQNTEQANSNVKIEDAEGKEKVKTAPTSQQSAEKGETVIDDEEELSNDSPRKRLAAFLEKIKIEDVEDDGIPEKLPPKPPKEHIEDYIFPPISMLSKGSETSGESPEIINQNILIIQRTLEGFGVSGKVVRHVVGPRTTRYEISLADGSAVNKFMRLESTFAAKLAVSNICLLSSIRGTNTVGIEIPNAYPRTVFMRNVMETDQWRHNNAAIPIVIGENSSAEPIVIDLAQAPHLLIGGSTGSGKSVCLDTLIMSLLFKFSPDELRLIMFDPIHIDFANYSRLPHLLTPVINKAAKLVSALRWTVIEMENRHQIFARAGVKKQADFNALSKNGEPVSDRDGKPIFDSSGNLVRKMPILIIIISEFAELHNQNSWLDAETYIDQITKSGRAAGIHIVMTTQRPSADIVSGKIKANFPVRIAFRVPQNIDSRIILDQPGAEKLFGQGDMLAKLPGVFGLERIQGALVNDKDIKAIMKFVSDQKPQNFDDTVMAEGEEFGNDESNPPPRKDGAGTPEEDDLFGDMDYAQIAPLVKKYLRPGDDDMVRLALEVVILDRKASTSYIQRRLKIGYNRAAELIDTMEERGIVGPPSGSGNKREILIFDELEISY